MTLFPELETIFTKEQLKAKDAQKLAHLYSWGPIVFQVARLMRKYNIFKMLSESKDGLTEDEIAQNTHLSIYAVKCLMEASLTMQTVLIETSTHRYRLAKTGWFLLNDPLINVNIDFNHDVNYEGWFLLDKAIEEGRPAGLKHFGDWSTIYQGLSKLPDHVQKSWFGFDHYYSNHSFEDSVNIIFSENKKKHILDVGGNTGNFARFVTEKLPHAKVTVCDLPEQLEMLSKQNKGHIGENRIFCYAMDLLNENDQFHQNASYDAIWMSQFLDCFSEKEIISILQKVSKIMNKDNRLYIMETLWDRQKYVPAAFCLTMTSLYFTALANGNSKMYDTDTLSRCIDEGGFTIEKIYDNIGMGDHSILVCKLSRTK